MLAARLPADAAEQQAKDFPYGVRKRPLSADRPYDVFMGLDRSLAVGEESVEVLHPHWKTLVGPIVLLVLVVAALLAAEVLVPSGKWQAVERLVVGAVAIAAFLWWVALPFLAWRSTVYEVTTRRMRIRDGIVTRNGRDIPLSRITDVSFRKGILDRLLGCGTLVVESAGEHGELTLTEIPRVERVSSLLFQLVEDERVRESRPPDPDQGQGGWPDPRRRR
jgi:uncharacterized membrane protein YdbT with pleckstrin-like domain